MVADRCAVVAEEVMGWRWSNSVLCVDGVYLGGACEPLSDGRQTLNLPPYDTDMAAAWTLVERIRGMGPRTAKLFLTALHLSVSRRLENPLLIPAAVVLHLEPLDICQAAVATMRKVKKQR